MSQTSALPGTTTARWPAPQVSAAPKISVLMVSGLLSAAIPLILSLYWIAFWLAPESLGAPLRISVVGCSMLLGLFWYRAELSHSEILLFRVLAVATVLWLIPTLLANDPAHALLGWIKLVILFTVCCFTTRGLRHPPTAHVFGLALLAGGMILGVFILFTYVRYLGFSLPTYKAAREFKGLAQVGGVPLNSIAFGAVFSYVMGLCLVGTSHLRLAIGLPLLLISSLFTGSRAPLVILGASVFVLLCMKGLRSQSVKVRLTAAFLAVAAVVVGIVILAMVSDQALNRATEGRSHLWPVGIEKFLERPLYGFGYESWREDLVSRLPGESDLTFDLAKTLGGGYHNEYVSVLAEEGLLGALAVGLIVWLLLRSSWLLTFRRWATVRSQAWILFAAIFLLLRANFEVPGLFGYAQEPLDYLAYIFLAIVMSRFSIEEDYGRLLARTDSRSAS